MFFVKFQKLYKSTTDQHKDLGLNAKERILQKQYLIRKEFFRIYLEENSFTICHRKDITINIVKILK